MCKYVYLYVYIYIYVYICVKYVGLHYTELSGNSLDAFFMIT